MPLREALRGLRFLLRRGGETVADTLSIDALPKQTSSLAAIVLREVEGFARSVDTVTSNAAKTVLGGQDSSSAVLDEIIHHDSADIEFAQAIYRALGAVLRRFGSGSFFVSEMSARTAFSAWRRNHRDEESELAAAELTLRLLDARVIRGGTAGEKPGAAAENTRETAAVVAVMLWLQSSRSDAENEAALEAAADIALAKAPELASAVQARDLDRIAAYYRKYVDHV